MTKLSKGTWVVIADGEKALFLENMMDDEDPNLVVRRVDEQENPPDHEQGTDSPGRMADDGPGHRSAFQETDWHELAKMRFADDLAERLYKMVHKGRIERLVIVAAPRVLGEIRSALHKEVSDVVVAEIDKTLTNHPRDEIEKLVKEELATA
ncbi:Host attachment protein [Thioclava sp. DLFJ5-1]|uniref:baeRF12 domain-containing protein n=1 Tax=Thioclava sp. DLFJ5-1 TaxID=1915314 RepID=UPI0009989CC6|nr:host attachment family protein [Thioclava sp. DLFJ5-1]OOY21525.1 Host attachment protein [Thioclava sp. DLFJ5-1]